MRARKFYREPDCACAKRVRPSRFEVYSEDNAADAYGQVTMDLYGHEFPDFDYTSPS
jgi:hypothetical protein